MWAIGRGGEVPQIARKHKTNLAQDKLKKKTQWIPFCQKKKKRLIGKDAFHGCKQLVEVSVWLVQKVLQNIKRI